jgi:DNA-binding transcriptional LysR family regulator
MTGAMDSVALETFLAVYREGGFSGAAKSLYRTQPAISRRIHLLEEELGVPLFERVSGGAVLSQAGRVLLPHAERALAVLKDAEAAIAELKRGNAGPVSLAVVGTLAGPELTAVLKAFVASQPDVDLMLRTARSTEVSEIVRRGDAVLGLRYDRDRSRDLHYERLAAEPLTVVCAAEHPRAGRRVSSLRTLRNERWIAFPEIPGQREISASHAFGIFLTRGLGEVDWQPVDSLTAQKRLVEAGLGLALMTKSGITEELSAGRLATIEVRDLGSALPVYAVTRKNGFLSAAAGRLVTLLREGYPAAWPAPGLPKRHPRRSAASR